MVKKIRILHPEELPGDAEQISRVLRQGLTDLNKVFDSSFDVICAINSNG